MKNNDFISHRENGEFLKEGEIYEIFESLVRQYFILSLEAEEYEEGMIKFI